MRRLAIQVSQVTYSSLDSLLKMPMRELLDLSNEVSEVCQAMAR